MPGCLVWILLKFLQSYLFRSKIIIDNTGLTIFLITCTKNLWRYIVLSILLTQLLLVCLCKYVNSPMTIGRTVFYIPQKMSSEFFLLTLFFQFTEWKGMQFLRIW